MNTTQDCERKFVVVADVVEEFYFLSRDLVEDSKQKELGEFEKEESQQEDRTMGFLLEVVVVAVGVEDKSCCLILKVAVHFLLVVVAVI